MVEPSTDLNNTMARADKSTVNLLSDGEQASITISPFKISTDDLNCGDIELGELTDRDAMIPPMSQKVWRQGSRSCKLECS